MGKIRKRVLEWSLALLVANQVIPPVAGVVGTSTLLDSYSICVPEHALKSNLPGNFNARDYINLANSITHRYEKKSDYCKEITTATLQTYNRLLQLNHRNDLSDKVRVVADINNKEPHLWLQIKEEDWVNYDSMQGTRQLQVSEIKRYSRDTKAQKASFDDGHPAEVDIIAYPDGTVHPTAQAFAIGYLTFHANLQKAKTQVASYEP